MHIVEEQFGRDRRHRPRLGRGHIRPYHLHHVVEQHTKGKLKDRALWRGANERLEMKDFGDLLKHPLNTPAGQIEVEQLCGRKQRGVQQISKQNNRLFPRPVQGETAHEAALLSVSTPQPAPVLLPPAPLPIHATLRRMCSLMTERRLGMIAHEKLIPALRKRRGLREITKLPIGHPYSPPGYLLPHLG